MSELITQHCALLEQWEDNNELYQDRDDILNDFHRELVDLQSTNVIIFRQEMNKIINLLSDGILNLSESFLIFLLDYFIHLIKQWHELIGFKDENDVNTFENLENIFTDHSDHLMNELLVKEFNQCLYTIARIGKDMFTNESIQVITRMLATYIKIESANGTQFIDVSQFHDGIMKCVYAPYTVEVFTQFKSSAQSEERSLGENFVFNGLFQYLKLMNTTRLYEESLHLRKHLLGSVSDLLDTFLISSNDWSNSSFTILIDLTTLFLYHVKMTEPNDICLDIQKHICDTAIRILLNSTYRSMKFNNNCLQYIYMGTMSDKILDELKSQKLTSTMFNIANLYKNESEIQFNVYRILAAIMTEDDIKKLDDPGAIAQVFLKHLTDIKDLAGWEVRIKNLLTTLKSKYFIFTYEKYLIYSIYSFITT